MSNDEEATRRWWEERVAREAAEKDARSGSYNPPPSEHARAIYDKVHQDTKSQITTARKESSSVPIVQREESTSSAGKGFFGLLVAGLAPAVLPLLGFIFLCLAVNLLIGNYEILTSPVFVVIVSLCVFGFLYFRGKNSSSAQDIVSTFDSDAPAHITLGPKSNTWVCSNCEKYVRRDATLCKHCKLSFRPFQ
jgi:hypothetical protein